MIRVAGYVAGTAVGDFAGLCAEGVPDARTTAVFIDSAFDLVAG